MNKFFMEKALVAAELSGSDVPVGAVIVKGNEILACCHNEKELNKDVTAHAEILAVKEASKKLDSWRLDGCELYVTLEPCPMCSWALLQARISKVYFGSYDTLYGAFGGAMDLRKNCNSGLIVKGGILEDKCNNIIKNYFRDLR